MVTIKIMLISFIVAATIAIIRMVMQNKTTRGNKEDKKNVPIITRRNDNDYRARITMLTL